MAHVRGTHVNADFGQGTRLAHLEDDGHEVAGANGPETKFWVQNPENGKAEELAYREPGDRDEQGSGGTFWDL